MAAEPVALGEALDEVAGKRLAVKRADAVLVEDRGGLAWFAQRCRDAISCARSVVPIRDWCAFV
jgi:hypothetical protein